MARSSSTISFGRRSAPWILPAILLFAGLISAGALFSPAGGCSSRAVPQAPALDCAAAEAPYERRVLESYDPNDPHLYMPALGTGFGWYTYGDWTPGAVQSGADGGASLQTPIPNGGRCGDQYALFFHARGFQDYGCGWGTYSIGAHFDDPDAAYRNTGPQAFYYPDFDAGVMAISAADYEGITFWAQSYDPSGTPTTKGFTITINDKESFYGVGSTCVPFDGSMLSNGTYGTAPNTSGGAAGGSAATALPPADACGNGFAYVLTVTDQWQLYTIPWSAFNQLARPNRQPTRFDPSSFFQITVAAPKEAYAALWWDEFGFYRTKKQ
jgi:hypothetical protein